MAKGWKFEDNSKEVKKRLAGVSEEAMEAAVLFIEGQAKSLAPVSSGELRDKIDHSVKRGDDDVVIGKVGSPLDYATYIEYGKKPVPYKNRAKSVNIFYVYIVLDNWRKMAYNLIKEMIICNEMLKVDLLRGVTRIILV
ncbi:TPA: HK97 gp10 family phage protein [Streptococcus suis]